MVQSASPTTGLFLAAAGPVGLLTVVVHAYLGGALTAPELGRKTVDGIGPVSEQIATGGLVSCATTPQHVR